MLIRALLLLLALAGTACTSASATEPSVWQLCTSVDTVVVVVDGVPLTEYVRHCRTRRPE